MNPTRSAYLVAARSAVSVLADDAVAASWKRPSALERMSVGALAGHLAFQVLSVEGGLSVPAPTEPPRTVLEHYESVPWVGAGLDDEVNIGIRRRGEAMAEEGAPALSARTASAVERLENILERSAEDRVVGHPWLSWALRLDDFLTTRMMEIVVHSDDLAVSVGVDAPQLPGAVLDPVLALLTTLAARRHGQAAVVRALTRAERSPASIVAF